MQYVLMPFVHDNNIDNRNTHDNHHDNQNNNDGITQNDRGYICGSTWHMLTIWMVRTLMNQLIIIITILILIILTLMASKGDNWNSTMCLCFPRMKWPTLIEVETVAYVVKVIKLQHSWVKKILRCRGGRRNYPRFFSPDGSGFPSLAKARDEGGYRW